MFKFLYRLRDLSGARFDLFVSSLLNRAIYELPEPKN